MLSVAVANLALLLFLFDFADAGQAGHRGSSSVGRIPGSTDGSFLLLPTFFLLR